jgi:GT2 family glycosyltransferase
MLRSAVRRIRSTIVPERELNAEQRWRGYLDEVEPTLMAHVRVHRFAEAPQIGDDRSPALPLAVWIEGRPPDASYRHTRDALTAGSVQPAEVLSGALSEALSSTRCERVMLMRAGDTPAPRALERLGQAAAIAPDAAIITCDDDELSSSGARHAPRFRPGPSPDRWLACDDSGAVAVVSRSRAAELIGERSPGPGWRHELAITLAGPNGLAHAHIPQLLCHRSRAPAGPADGRLSAAGASRALARWEPSARCEESGDVRRVRRPLGREPSVEIIICFRDRADLTQRCVDSLLAGTAYERFRVTLVDNGSIEPETAVMLDALAANSRIRVRRDDRPFNFAALNNGVAGESDADALVFLNNDTELLDADWIEPLLEEACRPEVGAVAPLLLFEDETVQHAGAALGIHGYAGHPFAGLGGEERTPFGYATEGTRNWLAVSAACMMVQRSKFQAVGGFDESFVVAGNDVDLCLRLTAGGHRTLCVPHVRLRHDESRSRGGYIDPGDFAASARSYGAFRTIGDPFYNPNLTLTASDCGVRAPGEGGL